MTSNVQVRDAAADPSIEDPQGPGKRYSRIFGALFLAGFLVYGIGFGLVRSVTTAPDFMSTLAANSTVLVVGAFLMLLNTVVDIGKGVLFFTIAERRGKRAALVYLLHLPAASWVIGLVFRTASAVWIAWCAYCAARDGELLRWAATLLLVFYVLFYAV